MILYSNSSASAKLAEVIPGHSTAHCAENRTLNKYMLKNNYNYN